MATATAARPKINESELQDVLAKQEEIRALEAQLKGKQKELEALKESITAKVLAGAKCIGSLVALMIDVPVQTKPSWKTIAYRYGQQLAFSIAKIEMDASEEANSRRGTRQELVIQPKP